MNLKKATSEIREYVRTRILYLKEKSHSVKDIGNLLNIHDDYVYQVLKKYRENGNKLPPEKIRGRKTGEKRRLSPDQESEIKFAITEHTPDYWKLPYSLWSLSLIHI